MVRIVITKGSKTPQKIQENHRGHETTETTEPTEGEI